jgi:Flp pilus assembly protein TadG
VSQIASCIHRLRADQRGTVAMTFALCATALFGAIALAMDMARSHNLNTRITSALDAAALAGAKSLDGGAPDAEVEVAARAFFNAQLANQRIHGVTLSPLAVVIDRDKSTVGVTTDAEMATTFAAIVGTTKIQFNKSASVTFKARDVELAMALDITGSMNDGTKLADMRLAAKDVLDTLLTDAKTDRSVRVAVVPWAASVNAGTLAAAVSNGHSSDGCVIERSNGQINDAYPSGANALRGVSTPYGYYTCPTSPVMPLVGKNKQNDLRAMLDNVAPNGGTAGHIGMSWAWYMLSPSWGSLLPTASQPGSYSPSETVKAVLLMSDGDFNMSYLSGASTDLVAMTNESYQQFQDICAGMKQKRITVFMVGFGVPEARAQTEMQACATSPAHYFQAVTGNELKTAFMTIAMQLKQMRLTK